MKSQTLNVNIYPDLLVVKKQYFLVLITHESTQGQIEYYYFKEDKLGWKLCTYI